MTGRRANPTVSVANIDKLVRDEIVAIVNGTWSGHRQTIEIKHSREYGEYSDKLNGKNQWERISIDRETPSNGHLGLR